MLAESRSDPYPERYTVAGINAVTDSLNDALLHAYAVLARRILYADELPAGNPTDHLDGTTRKIER